MEKAYYIDDSQPVQLVTESDPSGEYMGDYNAAYAPEEVRITA